MNQLMQLGQYRCSTSLIGKGFSSKVYKGVDINQKVNVAFKITDRKVIDSPLRQMLLNNQIRALEILDHPFILDTYTIKRTHKQIIMIIQYCQDGDLMNYIKKNGAFQEKIALQILLQLASGVNYIHSMGILHRDLKTSNILLKGDGTCRITDFGVCEFIKQRNPKYRTLNVGSPLYMSPEVQKKCQYSSKSDCWSLGIILYQMLLGKIPFQGLDYKGIINFIKSGNVTKSLKCSELTKRILNGLLNSDVNLRWDTIRLLTQLSSFKSQLVNCLSNQNNQYSKLSIVPGCWF